MFWLEKLINSVFECLRTLEIIVSDNPMRLCTYTSLHTLTHWLFWGNFLWKWIQNYIYFTLFISSRIFYKKIIWLARQFTNVSHVLDLFSVNFSKYFQSSAVPMPQLNVFCLFSCIWNFLILCLRSKKSINSCVKIIYEIYFGLLWW